MAKITVAPRVRCDNCGREEEQVQRTGWGNPHGWETDAYGFDDLCPKCVQTADSASEKALARIKGEGFDGPTGAE